MRYKPFIALAALLLAMSQAASAAIQPPDFVYSQDGIHFEPLPVLKENEPVSEYLRLYHGREHPRFGAKLDTETVAVYWDQADNAVSLLVVSGAAPHGYPKASVRIDGLPVTTETDFRDHANRLHIHHGSGKASVVLDGDPGIASAGFDDLGDDPLTMDLAIHSTDAAAQFQLITGSTGHDHGQIESLDLDSPLVIESLGPEAEDPRRHVPFSGEPGAGGLGGTGGAGGAGGATGGVSPGNGVPEPANLALLGIITVALLKRPRRAR